MGVSTRAESVKRATMEFRRDDPERVQIVKQMLGTAVDHGLQVILLTCDPAAYGGFADQTVEMKA